MKLLLLLLALPMFCFGQKCISGNCVNGQGTYTWANGDKYVGEYMNSVKHGQGTYTYASGDKYVGEYMNDITHGQGTYTWANGDKYVGENMNGMMHGQGTYTSANGTIKKGLWKNDEFVGE